MARARKGDGNGRADRLEEGMAALQQSQANLVQAQAALALQQTAFLNRVAEIDARLAETNARMEETNPASAWTRLVVLREQEGAHSSWGESTPTA